MVMSVQQVAVAIYDDTIANLEFLLLLMRCLNGIK